LNQDQTQQMWNLWNLRTLFPNHGPKDLIKILSEGESFDLRQEELRANPRQALAELEKSANDFLNRNSELKKGLIISLHLGPYSLAPVPWLLAGLDVHILVNKMSLAEIKPIYDELHNHLSIPGQVIWVPIDGSHFAVKIIRQLRLKKVVFAFLDGNDGLGGSQETLREGMSYKLPGRNIKVRTGLARLASRCNAPIHSVTTIWPAKGEFQWERGPTWAPNNHTPPEETTEALFDWAFKVIKHHAPQWKCWNMLTGVYESFSEEKAIHPHESIDDKATIKWTGSGKLWPGDMLEDLIRNCFFSAEGLSHNDINRISCDTRTTVTELKRDMGDHWVSCHLPRLASLGFISIE